MSFFQAFLVQQMPYLYSFIFQIQYRDEQISISFRINQSNILILVLSCFWQIYQQVKMFYPAVAASISGALMFMFGKLKGQQSEKFNQQQRQKIQEKLRQQQAKAKQQAELAQLQKQKLKAALATPKVINTFFDEAIQLPIVRLNYKHFKIVYSNYHKGPLAVHQLLDKQLLQGDGQRRTFFTQKKLDARFAATDNHFRASKAYYNFYLARGHMAAAGNYGKKEDKDQTFTLANIIPQNQKNNGGIWNTFERYTRSLLQRDKCKTLQVISGPVYSKNFPYVKNEEKLENIFIQKATVLLENGVTVPDKLYKIIKCNRQNDFFVSGYLFENSSVKTNHKKLIEFQEPIQNIQVLTGLKFNLGLGDSKDKIDLVPPAGSAQQPKKQQQSLQKPKRYKSLSELDTQLSRTKGDLDFIFFDNKIRSSKSLNDFIGNFRRCSDQDLGFKYQQYPQIISQLAKDGMKSLSQDKQTNACGKLKNYMNFNKDLQHLKSIGQYQELIKENQMALIKPCLESDDVATKEAIRMMLQRRRKWFKFINNDELSRHFAPQVEKKEEVVATTNDTEISQ